MNTIIRTSPNVTQPLLTIEIGDEESETIEVARESKADKTGRIDIHMVTRVEGEIEFISIISPDDAEIIGRKLIQAAKECREVTA